MSSKIDPRDRNFTKFLLDAPALDETCVDDFVARRFVEDRDRMQLGVTTLRDMVNLRPAMREKCMALLLGFCLHPDKATRQFSIQTCRRWVPDNVALASEVMKAASDAFHSITALQPEEADSETMEDDLWGIDTPYSGLPEVTCLVEFYFALCSKDHELLRE